VIDAQKEKLSKTVPPELGRIFDVSFPTLIDLYA
jgi:hypothetical protein